MTIGDFLRRQSLDPSRYPMEDEIRSFRADMERGLAGEPASLLMIPTFLSAAPVDAGDRKVIVLDAGGTNLRVGVVTFVGGETTPPVFEKFPMPGTEGVLTCDQFFDAVAEKLEPYLAESDQIGFCFSYATTHMENGDAKLISFCKEVQVTGAEGVEIRGALAAAIARRGHKSRYRVALLNDTLATMLGGMTAVDRDRYDGFMGFILGTGMNGCYDERTEAVGKYRGTAYRAADILVNMECGYYDGFAKGDVDRAVDAESELPGDHPAEKLMSGAYLGKILAGALRAASSEGLLKTRFSADLRKIPMPDVNRFLAGEPSCLDDILDPADRDGCRRIIEGIYGRAARLMAVIFTAVALHTGWGKNKPMAVILEGSTYQKSPLLKADLAEELAAAEARYGLRFEILEANSPTLIGAACAAAGNT